MPKDFFKWADVAFGKPVEAAIGRKEAVANQDMQVRMEDQIVTEGMHGGDGTKLALGENQLNTKYIRQGLNRAVEEVIEESPALAKNATQDLGYGEDDLAVGHAMADAVGDPLASATHPALMAGGAKVSRLAGEGEQAFVAAVGALESGEA